jgi:SAM-dependent methyltransferase
MAAESMIRNLAAQATVIWPEESRLLERYVLPERPRIADIGCGSGEISARLARRFPDAQVTGVDVLERTSGLRTRSSRPAGRATPLRTRGAWRDGYAATLESHARWAPGEAVALFDRAISAVLDPDAYVVWHVPVVSGQKPGSS